MNKEKQSTKNRQNAQYAASHMQHAFELHIEQLVLHGFAPGDHHRIRAAVETELVHLFAEQGVSPSLARGGEIPRLDSGRFEVSPGSTPEAIGSQVAQALYGELNR